MFSAATRVPLSHVLDTLTIKILEEPPPRPRRRPVPVSLCKPGSLTEASPSSASGLDLGLSGNSSNEEMGDTLEASGKDAAEEEKEGEEDEKDEEGEKDEEDREDERRRRAAYGR